jgi:predicted TIM-barrel fold metal-dependent hydrolase
MPTPEIPMSRRRALKLTLSAGGAATVAAPLLAAMAQGNQPRRLSAIDAHSHIWTREIDRFPLAAGVTLDDLKPASFTSEELLETARPAGVDRVVLIGHTIYHGFDNSYLIDAAQRYPKTFRIVGMLDDEQPGVSQSMQQLLGEKVTGFRITPWKRGSDKWLAGPGMTAMWKTAAETRQAMCCLIDPNNIPQVDAMCRKHPETPVVIDHFARIGTDGVIRDADVKRLCQMAAHKQVWVKISAFYALGKKAPPYTDLVPMIRKLFEAFGPQRLMWASDSPYQLGPGHTYSASIDLVRDLLGFLTSGDREWLLRKTAEKVYYFI